MQHYVCYLKSRLKLNRQDGEALPHAPSLQEKHTQSRKRFPQRPSPHTTGYSKQLLQETVPHETACRAAWTNFILAVLKSAQGKNSCLETSYCNTSVLIQFCPNRTNSFPSPVLSDTNRSRLSLSATGKEKKNVPLPKTQLKTFLC